MGIKREKNLSDFRIIHIDQPAHIGVQLLAGITGNMN